jgi:hypothetical protein
MAKRRSRKPAVAQNDVTLERVTLEMMAHEDMQQYGAI